MHIDRTAIGDQLRFAIHGNCEWATLLVTNNSLALR